MTEQALKPLDPPQESRAVSPQESRAVSPQESRAVSPQVTPMELLQVAMKQDVAVEKLEKLMQLQERWEANESRKAYVEAMTAFNSEGIVVGKNNVVDFGTSKGRTHYRHATLDNVVDMLAPALAKHGLSFTWQTAQDKEKGTVGVTCTLTHVMGHQEAVKLEAPFDASGNKNAIQAIGSTVTYLQRYTLLSITGTATKEQDDDGASSGAGANGVISEAEQRELRALLDQLPDPGAEIAGLCGWLNVESLSQIPVRSLNLAKHIIERKIAAEKNKEQDNDRA